MTDNTQPNALRLADRLQAHVATYQQLSEDEPGGYASEMDQAMDEAAAELRRQHARIAELESELEAVGAGGVSGPPSGSASLSAQAEGWRPISTAPKDGALIVLGARNGVWLGKYRPVYQSGYRPENPWSSILLNHDHMAERYTRPTHWMPLPPSPTSAEGVEHG